MAKNRKTVKTSGLLYFFKTIRIELLSAFIAVCLA